MALSIAFQSCYFNIQGNGFWFCFRTLHCTKFAQSLYKVHFANRTNKSGYFRTNCLYWNTSLKNGEDVQVNIRRLLSSIIKPDLMLHSEQLQCVGKGDLYPAIWLEKSLQNWSVCLPIPSVSDWLVEMNGGWKCLHKLSPSQNYLTPKVGSYWVYTHRPLY